jgi:hypothetical protein
MPKKEVSVRWVVKHGFIMTGGYIFMMSSIMQGTDYAEKKKKCISGALQELVSLDAQAQCSTL